MAKSDSLKKLFRGYKIGDQQTFMDAALEIIADEKKKSHDLLANELLRILDYGSVHTPHSSYQVVHSFESLPKDNDKGSSLIEVRQSKRYLADLMFDESQSKALENVISEFRQWDVLEANGLSPSHKLLFCGPPGCGKTATAEAMASELGLPLLYVRFDSVISSLLGETSSNLRKVFDFINKGSWVILFDEFDAIGRSRDDASEHGELKRVVNSFLQLLDRYSGKSLVIAATNFEQALDPAIWRRFDEIVRFEKPDEKQINNLLKKKLVNLKVNVTKLTSLSKKLLGMSHAEVERVCFDILRSNVISGDREVKDEDLIEAFNKQERRKQSLIRSHSNHKPTVDV
jgi:SpoVK/Ycf46/Vps4 family AAA+-type ATPase